MVKVVSSLDSSVPDREIDQVTQLINDVYVVAENGLWKKVDGRPPDRVSRDEIALAMARGGVLIARDREGIVGSVCVKLLRDDLAEFGMLVSHPERRGCGIGSALVSAAEDWGRSQGCSTMQLELLQPCDRSHAVKSFLHDWYTRLGYRPKGTVPFEHDFPHLVEELLVPCDFTQYRKELS